MEKLKRFYNQNRKAIFKWGAIVFIAFILLRAANFYYEQKETEEESDILEEGTNSGNTAISSSYQNNNFNNLSSSSNESLIDIFLEYCQNEQNYSNAYEILTDETKSMQEYNTETLFIKNFITEFIQAGDRNKLNKIMTDTYSLEIYQSNILQTGNVNSTKIKYLQEVDGKVNIQDYIYKQKINKRYMNDEFYIKVKDAKFYKDFVEYDIEVMNDSNNSFEIETINLKVGNEEEINTLNNDGIMVNSYESKTFTKQYNVKFSDRNNIKSLVIKNEENVIEIEL